MNLRQAGGKVPIQTGEALHPYQLVDFPSRKVFDSLYSKSVGAASRDKYWKVLTKRAAGATLDDAGLPFGLTKERVRQIEAKFLRLMRQHHFESKVS